MRKTVLAYITRPRRHGLDLLVFRKKDCPESGIQVPGGTVEFAEREEEALYRKVEDEAGLVHLRFVGKLEEYVQYRGSLRNSEERHVFQVESLENVDEKWTHTVESEGEDDGKEFEYFWIPVCEALGKLAMDQGRSLTHLATCSKKGNRLTDNRNRLHSPQQASHHPRVFRSL